MCCPELLFISHIKQSACYFLVCYYNPLLVSFVFLQIALGSTPPCPTHLRTSKHSPGWLPLPCRPHPARKEHPVTAPTPPPHVSKAKFTVLRKGLCCSNGGTHQLCHRRQRPSKNNSYAWLQIMKAILSKLKKGLVIFSLSVTNI